MKKYIAFIVLTQSYLYSAEQHSFGNSTLTELKKRDAAFEKNKQRVIDLISSSSMSAQEKSNRLKSISHYTHEYFKASNAWKLSLNSQTKKK